MSDKKSIYKSFDSAQFLLETVWNDFPTIRTTYDGQIIKNKILTASEEFCSLSNKNYFKIKILSQGGFGKVGTVDINNKELRALIFSFSRDGKHNNTFSIKVLLKTSLVQNNIEIKKRSLNSISINDPLSDMIFGSILSHLYDIGLNPFIVKYFGSFVCKNNNVTMFIESSDFELHKQLSRRNLNRITPSEFENLCIQFLYCCYINKIYFGAVHFDSHLRNIMLTDVKNKEYIYQGRNFNSLKYFVFDTKLKTPEGTPIFIVIKKSKYILKLIDYGCMLVCFDRTNYRRFNRNLKIETDVNEITMIGAYEALENSIKSKSYANTVDILFTFINMYEYLFNGLDEMGKRPTNNFPIENFEYLKILNNLATNVFGFSLESLIQENPRFKTKLRNDGTYDWFMRNHDCGINNKIYEDLSFIFKGIANYCKYEGTFRVPFKNTKYYDKNIIFKSIDNIYDLITDENSLLLSSTTSDYIAMFNRFENLVNYENKCNDYNNYNCIIKKLYNQAPVEYFLNKSEVHPNFLLAMKEISLGDKVVFKDYNKWLNSSPIPKDKLNKEIGDLRIIAVQILKYKNINLKINDKMIDTLGLSIPIENKEGFFGINNPTQIYDIPFQDNLTELLSAVLTVSYNGEFNIEPYLDFKSRHFINENNKFEIPLRLRSGDKYILALTIGPILVWNKKIVYEQLINQKHAEIESQLVLLYSKNKNLTFLFIEGGSFMAPGLDKLSTAKLCYDLDYDIAICVSSGFSANILISNSKQLKYLSKSPIRINHHLVLDFSW